MAIAHLKGSSTITSGLELSTMIASSGTFVAFGPAQRRSKPFPDEFSTLKAEMLLGHSPYDNVE